MKIQGITRISSGVLAVCICLLLTSCSGILNPVNQVTATPGDGTTPTVTPGVTGSKPPDQTAQAGEKNQELVLWVPPQFDPAADTPAATLFQQQLDSFLSENPGIKITVRIKAADGAGGLLDSLSNSSVAAPSALPSLIALPRADMEVAALKGLIFPWNGITGVVNETDWYPYAKQLGSLQGNDFGLPFFGDALLVVYRPLQVSYAPDNWKDYAARGFPIAIPAADPHALIAAQMLYSNRNEPASGPEADIVTQDELKKVYMVINDGVTNGAFPYWLGEFESFDQTWKSFNDEQSNYAVTWASNAISSLPDNSEMALLPVMGTDAYTLADGWLWCIADPSPERHKLAATLAEHLVDADYLAAWSEANQSLPTRSSALDRWQDQSQVEFLDQLAMSAHPIPANVFISTLSPLLQQSLLGMVRGQMNYLQALDLTAKEVK